MNDNILSVFVEFGLQVKELEPKVYEVLNTEHEVSIDELEWALGECILLTSDRVRWKRLEGGISSPVAYVYYILLDYDDDERMRKYDGLATERFGTSMREAYKRRQEGYGDIGTIYSATELGYEE